MAFTFQRDVRRRGQNDTIEAPYLRSSRCMDIDRVRAVHGALLRCLRYNKRTLALLALGCFIVEIRRERCCGAEILVFNKSVWTGKKARKNLQKNS